MRQEPPQVPPTQVPPTGVAKVTAIIVCMTDGERPYAKAAVDSVARQTVPVRALCYVQESNGWIDAMVRDLPGITVRRIPLTPLGAVRNLGVAESTTEYVAFLDGDDVWLPQKTERQLALIESSGADLVGADHILVRADGVRFGYALARNLAMPSAWLVRRSVMLRHPFKSVFAEDGEWWMRTRDVVDKRRLPEFLIEYRVRPNSISSAHAGKRRKEIACRVGSVPVLREALLAGTWLMHHINRRDQYVWHDGIGRML
ncbi:glycosyltransferase family 2 protein [Novispirillum sp. DQ9]|uniref:glycosyltransferase family 2 protein n=1 Tax=Novispirillum sp. DQ9 TaxID=3398612 RepID=UPI003C7BB3E1